MLETPFKIYSASAGSGKTYTLAKEYLKIILSLNKGYKQILAVTFTNKAVNEMKERILGNLFEFSQTYAIDNAPAMFVDLIRELQISASDLQKKSATTLKEILHNYAFFDISTIDKFTHRLIRTFAKDLKLPQNFEVVLDTDLLLNEAVSRLINRAGSNSKLTKVLIDFALEKIDDDKSWDITMDLNKTGKLLFNETHAKHLKRFVHKEIDDFLGLRKVILGNIRQLEEQALSKCKEVLQLIDETGLQPTDFPRETLPNHFKKIIKGEFSPNKLYNNQLEQNLNNGKLLKSGVALPSEELVFTILGFYLNVKTLIYERAFLNNVYKNIVPLTVLNAIQQEVKAIEVDRDQISISEFNAIISNEIKDQPAPFIYERLGEKYRHYFIDEFQDTSEMQWNNLIPLIGNALEGEDLQGRKGSLFLVGDAKQAIYRWRGGKAEQFLNLVDLSTNPFVISPNIENLPSNFRSHEEIIKFNNDFFTTTSSFLNHEQYLTLFEEGNQQGYNTKKGGLVQLTFIEADVDEPIDDKYGKEVLRSINEVLEKKHPYKDICILVRGNKEGVLLANFLTQEHIPIISSESLLLKSSSNVTFLINLLYHLNDLENRAVIYELLVFLSTEKERRHQFIAQHLENPSDLLQTCYGFEIDHLKQKSTYDLLESAIKQFDLAPSSDAYINYLMDTVLEVEQKEGTGIFTFLSYWEKKKDKLSITAPKTINAVQIMTIHKAKGLEFPIVIFPYANSNIYKEIDPKLWLPVQEEGFSGFGEVLISKKQEVATYSESAKILFEEEQHRLELDAFNVLYVALTRAVKALYIITKKDLTSKGAHKTDHYSGLFIHYLKEKGLWTEERTNYLFGVLGNYKEAISLPEQEIIPFQYTNKERAGFRILTKSGSLWDTEREDALTKGNLIHYVMGFIETEKDIDDALNAALRNGSISTDEIETLKTKIYEIIHHPELLPYYKEGIIIKNEKDIITHDGHFMRPDRVVIKDNKATIIDYKTGKQDSKHKEQLYGYADALQSMGYSIKGKIIIYVNEEITLDYISLLSG